MKLLDCGAAERISEWAGDNTVKTRNRNRPRFLPWFLPNKQSESERSRPLVLPQEIQRLPGRELLVRHGALHLFKLDRVVSHTDLWFKHLA